jgi:acetolactate synthase small subunit
MSSPDSLGARSPGAAARRMDCFSVAAAAEAGALPRILEAFAQRGLVPARVHAVHDAGELVVDLQASGLDAAGAELVAAKLRALIDVRAVLTYSKGA